MGKTVIPVEDFVPYTINDLTVVIPHVSWHPKRAEWFFPQYIKSVPPEVVKNTIVVYDGDDATALQLDKLGLRGEVVKESDWSTYKMMRGFELTETRLCVRVHNDTHFPRNDWAYALVEQFNKSTSPQIIGAFNRCGIINREIADGILKHVPSFKGIYDTLEFDANGFIGSPFLTAYFTAAQSYVYKTIYPLVVKAYDGKMDKEDCSLTIISSLYNVKIVHWENLDSFAVIVGKPGEFEEDTFKSLPTSVVDINESNVNIYPKATFVGVSRD